MKIVLSLVLSTILGASTVCAQHSDLALDFVGESTNGFQANLTLGWSFTVNQPIKVQQLGFFDHYETDEDGLTFDHSIRLWTDSETPELQAFTTITNASTPMGSTASNGRWLFNPIMPVVLMPGQYVIGADDPACGGGDCDRFRLVVTEFTIPQIEFGEARSASPPGPPRSSQPQLNGGYFGPSMIAVPILIGDVNQDGVIDLLDVPALIDAISNGTYVIEADINLDGEVNLLDVQPFVDLLAG